MKKTIMVGILKGEGTIKIEIELDEKPLPDGKLDTGLSPVAGFKLPVLSIAGTGKNMGGQIEDDLPLDPEGWERLYISITDLRLIVDIWKTYHLNDMKAGTDLQQFIIDWFYVGRYDFNQVVELLESHCVYNDNGYRYGSKWLYSYIPEQVITYLQNLEDNYE